MLGLVGVRAAGALERGAVAARETEGESQRAIALFLS